VGEIISSSPSIMLLLHPPEIFLDFLGCFEMFQDVLRFFEIMVTKDTSPKPKNQLKTQRTFFDCILPISGICF
jgi:hypothetical protein